MSGNSVSYRIVSCWLCRWRRSCMRSSRPSWRLSRCVWSCRLRSRRSASASVNSLTPTNDDVCVSSCSRLSVMTSPSLRWSRKNSIRWNTISCSRSRSFPSLLSLFSAVCYYYHLHSSGAVVHCIWEKTLPLGYLFEWLSKIELVFVVCGTYNVEKISAIDCTFVHHTWNMSTHYLVKCRTLSPDQSYIVSH